MIGGFQNIVKIPELKRRIIFTLIMLAVYRLGCHVPTPGVNGEALSAFFDRSGGTLFGLFNMFSGGALSKLSVMALGIMPYISSAIILELLTVVVPHLERLKKEGEAGRKKITQYTRYGTVVLSAVQGIRYSRWLGKHGRPRQYDGCDQSRVGISTYRGNHLSCRNLFSYVAWGTDF